MFLTINHCRWSFYQRIADQVIRSLALSSTRLQETRQNRVCVKQLIDLKLSFLKVFKTLVVIFMFKIYDFMLSEILKRVVVCNKLYAVLAKIISADSNLVKKSWSFSGVYLCNLHRYTLGWIFMLLYLFLWETKEHSDTPCSFGKNTF